MIRVLFICHGNICRSPMAQYLLAHLAAERGLACRTQSAATSREEIGNPIYPPARRKLREKGIPFGDHRAVQMTRQDYGAYDLLLAMDQANVRNMTAIAGGDPAGKIRRLLDFTDHPGTLPTPGTPATLRPPTTTSSRAARPCWTGWRGRIPPAFDPRGMIPAPSWHTMP